MTLETLKVIITAQTDDLKKKLGETKKVVNETKKETEKSTSSIGKAFKGLAGKFAIAQLAVKGVEKAIKAFTDACKQGINNAYAYSKAVGGDFASNMDSAKSSLTYFANSLGSVLVPLLNAVIPLFTKIIDAISEFNNKLAKGMAILSGQKTYQVAKKTVEQYQKLNKQTLGFDELNIVNSDSKKQEMFDTKEVESGGKLQKALEKIKKLVKDIGKAFLDGFKLNKLIAKFKGVWNKIKLSGQNALNKLDLGKLKESIEKLAESTGNLFYTVFGRVGEFIGNLLADVIGSETVQSIIGFIPTAIEIIAAGLDVVSVVLNALFDILEKIAEVLKPIFDVADQIMSAIIDGIVSWWESDGEAILNSVIALINNIKDDILYFFDVVLRPIFEWLASELKSLWDNHLSPLWQKILSFIQPLCELIQTLYKQFLSPILKFICDNLVAGIKNSLDIIWGIVKPIISGIIDQIGNLIDFLKGLIKFITGVFSGDWKKAWEGIKDMFSAVWEGIKTVCKTAVNAIIGIINGMLNVLTAPINFIIRTLNSISVKIPDWGIFGDLRGKTFGFNFSEIRAPQIPYLAKGGIVDRATPAIIGENGKEAVVPLENNTEWIDTLAEKLTANNPTKLTLNVDGKALGYAVINNINSITRQTGSLQLALG